MKHRAHNEQGPSTWPGRSGLGTGSFWKTCDDTLYVNATCIVLYFKELDCFQMLSALNSSLTASLPNQTSVAMSYSNSNGLVLWQGCQQT